MKKKPSHSLGILLCALLLLSLSACRRADQENKPTPLRIGVLPILDALPLYVAESEGYFSSQGIAVDLIPVASAAERDQLMQAGQIDGVINDLVSVALYNRETPQITVVRFAMQSTDHYAQFKILAAPNANIQRIVDIKGKTIGTSEGTIIQYVTERLLEAEGLNDQDFTQLAIPKIPDRMALLEAGEIQAATLPEPLATLAMQKGASVILDDRQYPQYACSVISISKKFIEDQPETIKDFLTALEQATDLINADKETWSTLLVEKKIIPPSLSGTYDLPDYPSAAIPTEAQFSDILLWLEEKEEISLNATYENSIDASFLP